MTARQLQEGEIFIDVSTNEIVLPSGDRHSITGKQEVFVKLSTGEYKEAIELFDLGAESLVMYHVELGVGRVEQVRYDQVLRPGKGKN